MSKRRGGTKRQKGQGGARSDAVRFAGFYGEQFAMPARFNWRLFTKLLRMADDDVDGGDIRALILIDRVIDGVVRPEDRARFEGICDRECPGFEELLEFAMVAIKALTGNPTTQPSDSSDGLPTTSTSSSPGSSAQVIDLFVEQGRPDLAEMVTLAQEARSTATG